MQKKKKKETGTQTHTEMRNDLNHGHNHHTYCLHVPPPSPHTQTHNRRRTGKLKNVWPRNRNWLTKLKHMHKVLKGSSYKYMFVMRLWLGICSSPPLSQSREFTPSSTRVQSLTLQPDLSICCQCFFLPFNPSVLQPRSRCVRVSRTCIPDSVENHY